MSAPKAWGIPVGRWRSPGAEAWWVDGAAASGNPLAAAGGSDAALAITAGVAFIVGVIAFLLSRRRDHLGEQGRSA